MIRYGAAAMKALVWHGGRDCPSTRRAGPDASDDEVVLDVELAGICGSDLHAFRGHPGPRSRRSSSATRSSAAVGGAFTVYPLVA